MKIMGMAITEMLFPVRLILTRGKDGASKWPE